MTLTSFIPPFIQVKFAFWKADATAVDAVKVALCIEEEEAFFFEQVAIGNDARHLRVDLGFAVERALGQEPGEEPEWVEMGRFCLFCGFTQGQEDVTRRLEAATDWADTAEATAQDVEDEWSIP